MSTSLDRFQQANILLTEAYRHLPVTLLQADIPLDGPGYFTTHGSSLTTLRRYHQVIASLLFLLVDAEHGGQPFDTFLPDLPDSLRTGEVRRVFWNEQPIALSLHPDPLPPELLFTQKLSAILAWSARQGHPQRDLLVSEEARARMSLRDALPLSTFLPVHERPEEAHV
jgi:hypothetical protein